MSIKEKDLGANMNLSFAGCGFLGIYHVGVAVCFRKYAPHILLNKISGASIGAIAACSLLCDLPLGDLTSDLLRVCTEVRSKSLGPFHPTFNIQKIIIEGMDKLVPADAHLRVSGKLHVSLTRCIDGKNVIVSQFDSREDLINALLASAFIPVFSGLIPPKYRGVRYMDGGFSDNLPTLDENTITVSPFCGESDICPRDDSMQLFHINVANTSIELSRHNIYRILRILYPPNPETLSNMCKQGFDDALRFLHRNNLINCTRCLAVQSTFVVSDTLEESMEYDPQCTECKLHRQEALVSNLPDTVMTIFQEAIDSANKGLYNWLFKHRGMKLLSVLSLPYTLPCDMMLATITKLLESAPSATHGMIELSKYIMEQLGVILTTVNKKRKQISHNIICQLAISEYGGKLYQDISNINNKMNLNFIVQLDEKDDIPLCSNKMLSRTPSFTVNRTDASNPNVDDDTFDHILEVTTQHDAVMAFYYMENNKVKVTEIFDVSENDAAIPEEEFRTRLDEQIDNEIEEGNEELMVEEDSQSDRNSDSTREELKLRSNSSSTCSLYGDEEPDTSNLFSDPESDWTSSCYPETSDRQMNRNRGKDSRPESDRLNL